MPFEVSRLNRVPLALWCALFFGLAATILVAFAPHWILLRGVVTVGLDSVFHHIGRAARVILGMAAGGLVAALIMVSYAVFLFLMTGKRVHPLYSASTGMNAAAHPIILSDPIRDFPARKPIFADQELGAPFMSDEVIANAKMNEADAPNTMAAPIVTAEEHFPDLAETLSEPVNTPAYLNDAPAVAEAAQAAGYDGLSLHDMITRLEAGLAGRTPTPPQPPVVAQLPSIASPAVNMPPLSIVPRDETPASDNTLQEAMNTLSKLVGGAR